MRIQEREKTEVQRRVSEWASRLGIVYLVDLLLTVMLSRHRASMEELVLTWTGKCVHPNDERQRSGQVEVASYLGT